MPFTATETLVSTPVATVPAAIHTLELPHPRHLLKTAAFRLVESTIAPLVLFYGLLSVTSLRVGLLAALGWSYAAMLVRIRGRKRIPGVLLLGAVLLTVRTSLALATGSVFVYFLQPTLATFVVAGLFLVSIRSSQPLVERLAHDFCPLPESLMSAGKLRQFFLQISLLWALVYAVNGAATLILLLTSSLGTFLVLRTIGSTALTVSAIACSYLWFRSSLRREGVVLRWATVRP
ncbi:MAG: VC0807 family protein [Acidimicrobiales bacterium]